MLERVHLDDAAPDAPCEQAVQMREHAAGQNDFAAVGDGVDQVEACAAIDVGDEAALPCWQDVVAEAALDDVTGAVASLIALEPLLGDALE